MYDTIYLEEMHKPAVILVNEDFASDARSAASGRQMPGLRVLPETVPCECNIMAKVTAGVLPVIDKVIDALTRPLSEPEKSPKMAEEKPSRLVFQGTLEEVNRFFYKRGWGDGLPIVPPTEEAVREMLTGTDLSPGHVVGKLIPRLGKATVEKIAINAVMAGALPTYLPVLIAGVQAAMDPRAYLHVRGVSTSSYCPFWIINGPVRHDLRVNSGTGALSPGDIANAAIGRAMGFIIRNIGGARKGVEDMGVMGNQGKYSMVIGEDEEGSPWEPLHAQQGLKKEDSAISIIMINCSMLLSVYGPTARDLLDTVVYNVIPGRRGLFCLLLNRGRARAMAEEGWTREKIAGYISENARVPAYRFGSHGGAERIAGLEPLPEDPDQLVRILPDPKWIRVVVAGGPGDRIGLFIGYWWPGQDWATRKIELPANWDGLAARYKDVVPAYLTG